MTSNNLGSIYATTISSEKYIIIDSQNIELSGNVIISNSSIITNSIIPNITNNESLGTSSKIWSNAYIHDLSINNNIEISGNTIINGVLQVSGNATISGSTLYVPSSFTIDPNGHGDNTGTLLINGNLVVQGVTTTINSSVVDISDKMLVLASNASNSFEANGAGFEISGAKVNFLYNNSSTTFNSSIGMSISGNVVPVTNSVGSLGESGKIWDIAYIRELNVTNFTNSIDGAKIANETITSTQIMNGSILTTDICDNAITFDKLAYNSVGNTRIINGAVTHEKLSSNCIQSHNIVDGTIVDGDISANANILGSKLANNSITSDKINQANNWTFSQLTSTTANIRDVSASNIEVSGNIMPLRDISSNLGSSLNRWNNIYVNDLSVNTINGQAYSAGGASDSSINRVISISDNKITTATRVYQEISNNSNWNAVNGYYGLAKQSFPALNPLSCGAKAIAYWTSRQSGGNADFKSIIWAPKLRMFLTFPDLITPTNNIFAKYSYDGINWINISINVAVYIKCICWSEELGIFVAGSFRHPYAIYSYNGIEWFTDTTRDSDISFFSICWSPELGIFVAVTDNISSTYKACTSNDGINWIGATTTANQAIKWGSVCWAPELGLFVATNNEYNNTNTKVMTSNDGYNWTLRTVPSAAEYPSWGSVCWSPQLGIFVTVSWYGGGTTIARVMTSTNGIDWIIRKYNDGSNPAYRSVCWCAELGIFLITQTTGGGSYLYSRNGTDWIEYENISENGEYSSFNAYSVARSPELGIFVAVGGNKIWTSVLKGRIPTISNVFDSSFNKIDETGKWTFGAIDVSGALNVMGDVSAPNIYTKTQVDISFVSKQLFDASLSSIQLTNVYTKTEVDVSFVSKELFDASYNVLQTTIINNGSSGSVSITPKKFYNNNWNLLGNNITTIKDISGMFPYIMGSSADGYTIFVRWSTSPEYTSAPNQTQRRTSLGVYKFISNSWTQIGSTFLFPFDVPAWRYAENGNGDEVGFVDNVANQKTEYMNSAGNRIAFTVSMPKFGPNQGDYLPNENTTYIYDFNGTDWVSVGTPRVTNVSVLAIGFSFENSITKMFVLNTHTNITIFTHNGTSFVEDAAQISQQTIINNISYGYTAHFISTNGKVICIITNNKIILFKFNETSWEQYGNVITIPQWPTNDITHVSGSYDGSIFMSIYRGQTVNGDINAGMIKIFKHNSATNTWIQIGQDIVYEEVTYIDEAHGLQLGSDAKCISGDGTVITVGTRIYPDRYIQHIGPYLNGYVQAYKYSSVNNYWSKIGNDITGQNNERPGQYARLNYNGSVLILDGQKYRDTYSSIDSGRVRVFEIDI